MPHDGGYQLIALGLLPDVFRINLDWLLGELVAVPAEGESLRISILNTLRRIRGNYYFTVVDLLGAKYAHQTERVTIYA